MQEYVTRVERLPDGSLRTTMYRGGRRVNQEKVRNLRQGSAEPTTCCARPSIPNWTTTSHQVIGMERYRGLPAREAAEVFGLRRPRTRLMRRCGR